MTASALPNEGKTFTSINLAMSLALEQDITVLLVDADVAKRHISRIFGVEKEAGLLDVLKDETLDLESLIIPTDIPGLSLLPAGNRTSIATELLSSSHMERTVARLGAHSPNRIVLLDSPPLLLTSESRAIAAIVGQVVVVVNAQSTPQQAVVDAVSHIPSDKSVGFILNQCNVRASEGYYYGDGTYGETHG
jgi:receptor protein-tyrosine kinase